MNLVLQPSQSTLLSYKTSLFIYEEDFKRSVELLPESEGWIVGVIDMSDIPDNSFYLTAHVTYSFKNEEKCLTGNQLTVPNFNFNVDSYISGSNAPFSKCKEVSEVDVLSVISSSETTVLAAKHMTSSVNYIESAMKSQLKFEKVFKNFYFNFGTELPPLSGMLLKITSGASEDTTFRVYFRNKKQLDIFKHCISSLSGVKLLGVTSDNSSEVNVQEVTKALHAELECVNEFMKEISLQDVDMCDDHTSVSSELEVPSALYYSFRKKLSLLEMKTDMLLYGEKTKDIEPNC